jgi:hypothetical protein
MVKAMRTLRASREDIFAVLANGWTYSDWVVGTGHIRAVDADWPQAGSRIHHKTGAWPFALQDVTRSIACRWPELLSVAPRLRPLGEATVTITLTELDPQRTRVVMEEKFRAGPLRWVWTKLTDTLLYYRNRESLRRLADLATGRRHPSEVATVEASAPERAR